MEMIDFIDSERVPGRGYHGNAGRKQAYFHDGTLWMVKFPQNTRGLEGKHLPSYTSSPLSEYIGSHIYDSLGIPVHETVLGRCQGKIVVGCKDFTVHAELMDFHQIKNTMDEDLISGSFGSSASGERLSDVLRVIEHAEEFAAMRDEVKERFWDMFVTDAFILNNDRNNGNWGILVDRFHIQLAPVFDNGNALYNKRNPSLTERRLTEPALLEQDALQGRSFFTDDEDHHIHPFRFLASMENEDCNAAVLRFAERLDLEKVNALIDGVPEQAFGLPVMSQVQKEFYKNLLKMGYEKGIQPVVAKLRPF
ncbi:HipA domain-containing protein [Hominifimenecus sp. rT4P-3]|uniref:HipA domain-containing protein n=1 Tax=Hominifimenecus sp. rT4P-3 TaxID=3242979 RepID=UPI003DA24667